MGFLKVTVCLDLVKGGFLADMAFATLMSWFLLCCSSVIDGAWDDI